MILDRTLRVPVTAIRRSTVDQLTTPLEFEQKFDCRIVNIDPRTEEYTLEFSNSIRAMAWRLRWC